jgi:magnesium-protoporphyrin O-methyltransferase
MDACGCEPGGFASIFDRRNAERDRDRYRRNGPDRTTRMLLELLGPYHAAGSTVLDVGGGIGIIDHELLKSGAGHAVLVDGSQASLEVARQEARRLGLLDRIEFVEGDFVRRAAALDPAEIVTLDRVVCCYPDAEGLVSLSAARARTAYGLVLPRDRWLVRVAVRLENLWFRLRRSPYRAYVHPTDRVDAIVAATGLHPGAERHTAYWRVVVYDRSWSTTGTSSSSDSVDRWRGGGRMRLQNRRPGGPR